MKKSEIKTNPMSRKKSIEIWKKQLEMSEAETLNEISFFERDINFTQRRMKLAKDSLVMCKERQLEADKILKKIESEEVGN